MSPEMKKVLEIVIQDLLTMPEEDFNKLMESHRNSDIARACRDLAEFEDHLQKGFIQWKID